MDLAASRSRARVARSHMFCYLLTRRYLVLAELELVEVILNQRLFENGLREMSLKQKF
jgi:hypothetical protein